MDLNNVRGCSTVADPKTTPTTLGLVNWVGGKNQEKSAGKIWVGFTSPTNIVHHGLSGSDLRSASFCP